MHHIVHCINCVPPCLPIIVPSQYHHFAGCLKYFWAFTVVMLSESSQVSKQSDAFAKSFPSVFVSLWARLSTLSVRWGTLLPRYICWSYYYDPRCFRKSPSNLAMFCVPGVMILAIILESIPWCHLVVGILLLGSWPEIHSTYLVLIVLLVPLGY